MSKPEIKVNDWLRIGTRRAIVCNVISPTNIEIVYIDDRDRAINNTVIYVDDEWQFEHSFGGGYADKYDRLQPFVSQLRSPRQL